MPNHPLRCRFMSFPCALTLCLLLGGALSLKAGFRDSSTMLLSIRTGVELAPDAHDFMSGYAYFTGLNNRAIASAGLIEGAMKYSWSSWNVGVLAESWTSHFAEQGTTSIESGSRTVTRELVEDFTIRALPVLATVEYLPFPQQFQEYVGVGVGAAGIRTTWIEYASSNAPGDPRVGGQLINSQTIQPMVRLYCGVILGFDKFGVASNGSIIIEGRYSWCRNSIHPWATLIAQEKYLTDASDTANNVGISSLSLAIGIQFRFKNSRR